MLKRSKATGRRSRRAAFFIVFFLFFILKGALADVQTIPLPKPKLKSNFSLEEAISKRRSVRNYSPKELTPEEISQLLWAAQGITDAAGHRAAPSAGARYPLVVYLVKSDGIYLYVPEKHALEQKSSKNIKEELARAALGQNFVSEAPVDIVICAIYEKVASRYGARGKKYTNVEAGHVAENIHLQAVSLGLASCPVGAFEDESVSKLLNLEGKEKPIYIIPVGHKR